MDIVAVITLSTGNKYDIGEETYNQILEASDTDLIQLPSGTVFKKTSLMEITDIKDWRVQNDAHQPYSYFPDEQKGTSWDDIKQIAGKGFDAVLTAAEKDTSRRTRNLQALLRGLNKAKNKLLREGSTTSNVEKFIKSVEQKLAV